MQCSGGSLLRTPGRTSFRPESSEVSNGLGRVFQPEITATGAVAMLPQMEELLDDHVLKGPPRQPCEEAVALRKEFEQWQTRARTIMHAYAAAASQFFIRVAFVAWASNWQRPDVQAPRCRRCSAATSTRTLAHRRSLTDLCVFLDAWASVAKRGAKAKESLQLLSWSQDRVLRRSVFACWSSETMRLQRDRRLTELIQRKKGSVHLAFDHWRSEASRLGREKKLMCAIASGTRGGWSLQKEAFSRWSSCLRVATARRRLRQKLMHAVARWIQQGQPMHKAVFACWRIETSRQRLGKRMLSALDRQTQTGESIHKAAFTSWRAETSSTRHRQQLLDAVGGWIEADQSAGLVLWTFKEWRQILSGDGHVQAMAMTQKHENSKERMGDHFFAWKSATLRSLQIELRGARVSEASWKQSATILSVFRGWNYFARRSARIKVSLSAGIFAFQRLVLGAWKVVVSARPGTDSKQFSTPRRPDPMHRSEKEKDLGSRSTERSPMVLSEEQDQTKRNERKDEKKDEKNGTEVNTKMSRPRTLLEQLHWKAAQFSHPHVEPGPSIPVRQRDRAKDHPKNLPTPNRKASEPRKADGPKERIARQVRAVGAGPTGQKSGSPEPLAQLRLKLQDLQNFSADASAA